MTAPGAGGEPVDTAVLFSCQGHALVGVLSQPAGPALHDVGVVIVVGGPQYRAGSHRQFVLLARHLAAGGFPVLRFDYRGMGDGEGALRSFENADDDIAAAVDALQQRLPRVHRVVLWGLCDGASAALLYCQRRRDPRIAGLALLNPWVRSTASLARMHVKHYYARRLLDAGFWRKLLRGGVGLAALRELLQSLGAARAAGRGRGARNDGAAALPPDAPFQDRMAHAWHAFAGDMLLLLSGDDYTAKEFLVYTEANTRWAGAFDRPRLRRHDLADADHTLSSAPARRDAEARTLAWLRSIHAVPMTATHGVRE